MIQTDIFGRIPKEGDIIIFNPPKYKGLIYGTCIGFSKAGLPKVNELSNSSYSLKYIIDNYGFYTPKTGFTIK